MKKFVLLPYKQYLQHIVTPREAQEAVVEPVLKPVQEPESVVPKPKEDLPELAQVEYKLQEPVDLQEYTTAVSPKQRSKARLLLGELAQAGVGTTPERHLTIQGKVVPQSHIVDIVRYLMSTQKIRPKGTQELITHLNTVNFPWSLVFNPNARREPEPEPEPTAKSRAEPRLKTPGPIWIQPR